MVKGHFSPNERLTNVFKKPKFLIEKGKLTSFRYRYRRNIVHICWKISCTISTYRFEDFVALIALIALTRLQGYQSDWRGIQGVSKCLWAFSGLLSLLTRVTSGITNNNRYMFLKATRLSRRQEGWAGIGFSINSLFLMLLLSAMTIDHW